RRAARPPPPSPRRPESRWPLPAGAAAPGRGISRRVPVPVGPRRDYDLAGALAASGFPTAETRRQPRGLRVRSVRIRQQHVRKMTRWVPAEQVAGLTGEMMTSQAGVDGQPTEIGGYRLTTLLGQGGFGSVYLGEDAAGRRAAVKLLHGAITDEVRDSLAREVEAARRVKQFCIARVLDADPYAPRPWIATEYLEGPTLA